MRKAYGLLSELLKRSNLFGDTDVEGRIILKWSLKLVSVGLRIRLIWQRTEAMTVSYEHCNKCMVSTKSGAVSYLLTILPHSPEGLCSMELVPFLIWKLHI
jgi:hypothetical protein